MQVTETWKNSQVFHPPLWLKQRKGRQLSWNVKAEALLKPRVELQVLISKTYNTLWESSVGTLMGEARNPQRREGGKRPGLVEPTGFWWSPRASGGAHGLLVDGRCLRFFSLHFPPEAFHLGFADWVQPLFKMMLLHHKA